MRNPNAMAKINRALLAEMRGYRMRENLDDLDDDAVCWDNATLLDAIRCMTRELRTLREVERAARVAVDSGDLCYGESRRSVVLALDAAAKLGEVPK